MLDPNLKFTIGPEVATVHGITPSGRAPMAVWIFNVKEVGNKMPDVPESERARVIPCLFVGMGALLSKTVLGVVMETVAPEMSKNQPM